MDKQEVITYYAVSKAGTYTSVGNISELRSTPGIEFGVRKINQVGQYNSEQIITDRYGDDSAYRIGDFSIIKFTKNGFNHEYIIFNHKSEEYIKGKFSSGNAWPYINVITQYIFPKIAELTGDPYYMRFMYEKQILDLEAEVDRLNKKIEKLEEEKDK